VVVREKEEAGLRVEWLEQELQLFESNLKEF
jgi:hypothetical protein